MFVEPLRVTAAILAAAVTSATIFVATDLIGLLLPTMGADSLDLALPHIALLWPASFSSRWFTLLGWGCQPI